MHVPLLDLKSQYKQLKEEVQTVINEVCESQCFILGEKVEKFESEIADYCECHFACGVSSGSDALLISLMAEGIGQGDEVITTPFTFFATAGAIARIGAIPVFVDIEPRIFNMDAGRIEEKITSRTKAIIPVHLFGQAADMDKILEVAKRHNLIVIEDAAQSIGSEYEGKRVGGIGDYGCFSFFPSKNLGAFGDGGIVTTNDKNRVELLKILRNHGANPKYYHKYIGGNFRLDALQAAVLSVKLKYLDSWSMSRQQNAAEYRTMFRESTIKDRILMPVKAASSTRHIYNQFCVLVQGYGRDMLRKELQEAGIGSEIYYPVPLHLQECFSYLGYSKGDFPVSEKTSEEILALPIYPESTAEQRQYIVSTIEKILTK